MFDPTDPVPFVIAACTVALVIFLRGVLSALLRLMLDVISLLVRSMPRKTACRKPPHTYPHHRSSQHPWR